MAEVTVDPARAKEITAAVIATAADLQAHGVTPDELERAKKPILTRLREAVRTNPYWLGSVVGLCQEFPERLDWARNMQTDYQAVTKADLDALAKAYLAPSRDLQVIVSPEPAPAAVENPKK